MAKYSYITDKSHDNRKIQVESAIRDGEGKNIVNNYSKQNGYYENERVGLADNLASNRQIDNPETACPPITMGITGGSAEIKSGIESLDYLEGNSFAFNQLVQNGDFSNGTNGWGTNADGSLTVVNGVAHFIATAQNGRFHQDINLITNHKYLMLGTINKSINIRLYSDGGSQYLTFDGQLFFTSNYNITQIRFYDGSASDWTEYTVDNITLFDLTLIYGAGNEPTTVDEFKSRFPNDYYAYNTGSILSAKTNTLISRGRQQWDEQWEVGGINNSGQPDSNTDRIKSKNYIRVIPNTTYYAYLGSTGQLFVYFYDENENYLGVYGNYANSTFTTPLNCYLIRIRMNASYGTTYKNDVTISIYFEDGEGYNQYYPYSQDVAQLPNIELRAVNNVKDIAYASGGGKRKIGKVDLGTLTWNYDSTRKYFSVTISDTAGASGYSNAKAICPLYTITGANNIYNNATGHDMELGIGTDHKVYISNQSYTDATTFKSAMNGVYLLYELATETELTENTGFDNTINVDNYGTLEFTTSETQIPQVPQPYFIKYTVNLGEWIDSAYVYSSGDPENLALKEDVANDLNALQDGLEQGQIVVAKSLSTKQIDNVSVESGAIQETPFVYQGTGTANGTDIVDTSPVGKHLEKQGNTVVVNSQLQNGNFASDSGWTAIGSTLSVANNVATISSTTSAGSGIRHNISLVSNHKYLVIATIKANVNTTNTRFALYNGTTYRYTDNVSLTANSAKTVLLIIDFSLTTATTNRFYFYANSTSDSLGENGTIEISNVSVIDLTQWFNGDIPQDLLDNPSNFYRYYKGSLSYNTGTLVNSDGQYLECGQGRNVWDEETLDGYYSSSGVFTSNANAKASKNYIRVNPNTTYYFYNGSSNDGRVCYYDKDKNFVGTKTNANTTFTTPSNCEYIMISTAINYGTTYKHDITISLYYATGDGYDKYYTYVEPKVYDTGIEVLRKAGSVKDYKEPDGTIHRLVGVVDLGTLDWAYQSDGTRFVSVTAPTGIKPVPSNDIMPKIICSKYEPTTPNSSWLSSRDMLITVSTGGTIFIVNKSYTTGGALKPTLDGVYLFYELATPTTEQGTPFSENIEINDYSYMAWKNASDYVNVPQGCKIFYPADYVLFIDSVGQRQDINWDATKLVSQEQRTSDKTELQGVDTQLQNAIGGTLRNVLATSKNIDFLNTAWVDLGELTWEYNSTYGYMFSDGLSLLAKPVVNVSDLANILCSLYQVSSWYVIRGSSPVNMSVVINTASGLAVRNTTYTDADTFKNSMKGVLLAYEKAS